MPVIFSGGGAAGIAGRGAYYDPAGALRDMVQNHLFQLLCLIAMDARGNHAGFSNAPDQTYLYLTDDLTACVEAPRIHVETGDLGRRAADQQHG